MPAKIDKLQPSFNVMYNAFVNYHQASRKRTVTLREVVTSKDGLGFEGDFDYWMTANNSRNQTLFYKEWTKPHGKRGRRLASLGKGQWYATAGTHHHTGYCFRTSRTAISREQETLDLFSQQVVRVAAKPVSPSKFPFPKSPVTSGKSSKSTDIVIPGNLVPSVRAIIAQLKGVLDDPDFNTLDNLLNGVKSR